MRNTVLVSCRSEIGQKLSVTSGGFPVARLIRKSTGRYS